MYFIVFFVLHDWNFLALVFFLESLFQIRLHGRGLLRSDDVASFHKW